jgi:iron(III) transport system ATP-binding protein
MPNITLKGVQKSYGGNGANAVSHLDLQIDDGEFMCLLGPSGCGKTTTLRMISGLESLSGGELTVGDTTVDAIAKGIFVPPEKRQMGLVFQSYALWPHMTIERNVDFGLRVRKVPASERKQRIARVMKTLGIEKYADRYPSQLSGGQQQRVALARMLAVNPDVLLLDEPLSNLDARLRLEMRAELKRLHEEFRTTIVFVTHDQWEAMTLATVIAVMSEGHLQQVGTPAQIYERPANRFVAEFIGSPPINIIELANDDTVRLAREARRYLTEKYSELGNAASVGLRPEAIEFTTNKDGIAADHFAVEGTISAIMPTGGSWILEIHVDGAVMFQATHKSPALSIGDQGWMHVRPEDMHVFDALGNRSTDADRILTRH